MKQSFFPILFFLALSACSRTPAPQFSTGQKDTIHTPEAAMIIHAYEPRRALAIIDSAQMAGNASQFLADFLRAKTYAESELVFGPGKDSCILICQDLLKSDSTKSTTKEGAARRSNVLTLLTRLYENASDYGEWLQYATELSELEHKYGNEADALRLDAEIGLIMANLGWQNEGLQMMDNAIGALKGSRSVNKLDAYIVSAKRKILYFDASGHYPEVISLAKGIIDELDTYERESQSYAEDNFRLPDNKEDRKRWVDWYRAQALGYAANAFARTVPPEPDSTRIYLQRYREQEYSKTVTGHQSVLPAAALLGEWDEVIETADKVMARSPEDTSSHSYVQLLYFRALAAKAKGHTEEAYKLMEKHSRLSRELSIIQRQSQANQMVASYNTRALEFEKQKAEQATKTHSIISAATLLILLIATFLTIKFRRQRLEIENKNKALVKLIDDVPVVLEEEEEEEEEEELEGSKRADPELFASIDGAIKSEKLYANKYLQRQDIIDRFGISRHNLNNLLNTFADGQSFPSYINSIRLTEAKKLLKNKTDMNISAVAEAVGFSPANLRDQFKRRFGLTPAEYRQSL